MKVKKELDIRLERDENWRYTGEKY